MGRVLSVGGEEQSEAEEIAPRGTVIRPRIELPLLSMLETSDAFQRLPQRAQDQLHDYSRDNPEAMTETADLAIDHFGNARSFLASIEGRTMPEPVRDAVVDLQNEIAVVRVLSNLLSAMQRRDEEAAREWLATLRRMGGTEGDEVLAQTAFNNITALLQYFERNHIDEGTMQRIFENPAIASFILNTDINAIKGVLEPLGIVFDALEFQRILGQISGETERFARQIGMSDEVIEQARERSLRFRTREEYAPSRETRRRPTASHKESDVAKAALGEIIQQMAITIQQGHREEERERIRRRSERDATEQVEERERPEPAESSRERERGMDKIRRALAGQVGDETARQIEDAIERGLIRPRADSQGPATERGRVGERPLDDIVPRRVYTTVNGQDFEDDTGLLQGLRR